MKIIKLTVYHDDRTIYLAVDKIVHFYNDTNKGTVIITVESERKCRVEETPEEIIELIKQAEEI